ncbi:hypothetical protein Tco_1434860 [Tanacetum coccineum]
MYGQYEYGSQHTVGGSSSQPIHNVGGSSSQPNVGAFSSPVRHFSLDDDDFTQMYSPQFSESFREEQSPVEEMEEIQIVRLKVASFCGVYANTILTYTSGVGDADYLQRAVTDYHVEYRVPFTLLHCREVLKECDKWNSGEVPLFMQEKG